ncbi:MULTISPECIES: hypothetical protein [Clostridium]|uniref:Uncharacterized protein n=1 Tax=Clostridium frigoriphilum TaxID=443253 RepID=A0ABU7UUP6_9CLOT|nr:hypothetical protein [Clostridium sp. DSM 17811]MBU3101695.1 hypothetical protein [Clostridium sp. DSM 17811]
MYVNGSLIKNINESKLIRFLRGKNCIQTEGEKGKDISFWISDLLDDDKVKSVDLNSFFFEELFYGKSNMVNVFQINSCKDLRDEEVWLERLSQTYNIDSIQFNNIMTTTVTSDTPVKIVAINSIFDEEGKITRLRMILVRHICINLNGKESNSCCYLAVEFNLDDKLFIIKIRNQYGIVNKEHRPRASIDKIVCNLKMEMGFETKEYGENHQKVLYNMSKGLLRELYQSIPNYDDVNKMDKSIEIFIKDTIKNIVISNLEEDLKGNVTINPGVVDLKDELKKVLQHLIVSDYFLNEDVDVFSKNNVSAAITSIKFNDTERNTARLTGENNTKAIVCSRTFMSMRRSIEAVQNVSALSIAYKRKNDSIEVKFDASEKDKLSIMILNQKYYDESDFNKIWGIYKKYESKSIKRFTKIRKVSVG